MHSSCEHTEWEFCFWEPTLSPHKLRFLDALSRSLGVGKVTQVAEMPLAVNRQSLGWSITMPEFVPTIVSPTREQVVELLLDSSANVVHIFSGVHWVRSITLGIRLAVRHKRHFGIMSEPRDVGGATGVLRLCHSWISEGSIRSHANFVLAIGCHGPRWFRRVGYDRNKIIPFAYFVGGPPDETPLLEGARVRVGYLGRLTERKGFLCAINAFRLVKVPVELHIAGAGELEGIAISFAQKNPSANFVGTIPIGQVHRFLSGIDILIVPSLAKDGWGAVVGEGLLAGAAVLTSSYPGASACVSDDRLGRVVTPPTPRNFADAIDALATSGSLSAEARRYRSRWAQQHLTSEAGAKYFINVMSSIYGSSPRPEPIFPL